MLIEQLLSVDVVGVGAGAEHVVVVGGQGDVYAWGRGQGGFLILYWGDLLISSAVQF